MQINRCKWCLKDELYMNYHDYEWGIPSYDDNHLFEHLILETFQAGLSWYTILKKREHFRDAFDGFDAKIIAQYNENKIDELMGNALIIRSRPKILASINNAQVFLNIQKEFGTFSKYIWSFVNNKTKINAIKDLKDIQATTTESDMMAKDMKSRGLKFIGSTTCYAYMQAVGMVNDHTTDCWRYNNFDIMPK